jgi:hypothetical protein
MRSHAGANFIGNALGDSLAVEYLGGHWVRRVAANAHFRMPWFDEDGKRSETPAQREY